MILPPTDVCTRRGFGRGSRQMGTPTANIDPSGLGPALAHLPKGVYFG